MAKWTTAYMDSLPDSAFAWIGPDGERHLPYKNKEGKVDLPHVRDALARLNQVNGMPESVRNTVREKLQGSLKASDSEDDVMSFVSPIQASDGDNQLPTRMMLLRSGTFNTGKYGEVKLESSDLHEMAANFKTGIGMAGDGSTGIPVDFAHQSHLNAGAWIKDIEAIDKSNGQTELWATSIEFSDSGKKAILGKEYKCLSSDFYPASFGEWVDAESGVRAKNVIVGAAFTNRPLFTGNQPVVQASETQDGERQITKFVIANEKELSMDINAIRVKAADEVTGPEQRFLQAHASELSADERKKFELVETSQQQSPQQVQASSVQGTEGLVAIQASELKGMNDQIASLQASEKDRVKAGIREQVKNHIKRGAIKADREESWVNRIAAANEDDQKELLADLKAMADNPILAKEQGSSDGASDAEGGSSARNQLMAHASELMKKSKTDGKPIDIKAAYELAKDQHPELVEAAAADHRANLTASDDALAAAGVNRG